MSDLPRVTVWNEYRQEKTDEPVRQLYPEGMHAPIAKYLEAEGIPVRIATLDEPEHGLTEEVLSQTDVLTWWGHRFHGDVDDAIVERVHQRVPLSLRLPGRCGRRLLPKTEAVARIELSALLITAARRALMKTTISNGGK